MVNVGRAGSSPRTVRLPGTQALRLCGLADVPSILSHFGEDPNVAGSGIPRHVLHWGQAPGQCGGAGWGPLSHVAPGLCPAPGGGSGGLIASVLTDSTACLIT